MKVTGKQNIYVFDGGTCSASLRKSQSMSDLCRLRSKCERTKHILSKKVINDTKIIKNQAAVYSAAAQAAILSGDTSKKIKDILIRDDCFTFLPFNVVTSGGVITPFIERNTVIRDGNGRVMASAVDNHAAAKAENDRAENEIIVEKCKHKVTLKDDVVQSAIKESIEKQKEWLDYNEEEEVQEYEHIQKLLEEIVPKITSDNQ
ncbi:hypothetical protein GLOIN_2v1780709 [Rhizophagus irregularis DAOM 181602=DAOM 197198]|uniref:Uncharacterized protein n=1 Tax=Rhizophagus irregularis (strain DAOM 181602 / DAOM 197198 / MUCL 43194) TaxID=747089 RepID=A0A2P4PLL7_RHIID|nr:hypothetical protein GLOIN_2v1780709 [Rhizophagus irregularis DAOM 181602=DAOM 197198]POG66293.1 hypothetical protein GLOIN_2v1780709 [Rhizophagus irregularis DAOM 181602=DAOM 197198]|eukprot:XP_025173159.1 hypothetical protein GLOIN_2v1780709 [Rhizophagus irregularis DAOM 181602=DAOM 197198]